MKSEYLAEVKVITIPNYAIGLLNGCAQFSPHFSCIIS